MMTAVDVTQLPDWFTGIDIGSIIGVLIVLAAIAWLILRVRPLWGKVGGFLEDWAGEPDRPGVKSHPGVMVRLERIEEDSANAATRAEVSDIVGAMRAEMTATVDSLRGDVQAAVQRVEASMSNTRLMAEAAKVLSETTAATVGVVQHKQSDIESRVARLEAYGDRSTS